MAGESCKETIEVKSLLRAAPANRFSSCSTLIKNSKQQSVEVVFGTGQQIAIWNCTNRNRYPPLKLLKGHQAYVTVIKNLGANSLGFVSGDLNGTVLVWAPNVEGQWQTIARLAGQKKSISCLTCIQLPASDGGNVEASVQEYLIVAGASDGCLTSWKISITPSMGSKVATTEPIEALQTIQLGNQIALDAALAFIPNQSKHLLLALAGTDNKVAIYSLDFPSLLFSLCFRLPGHTDWVRCLDFTLDPKQPNNLLLVSGSQDNFIRIWRCDQQDIPTTQRPLDPVNDSRTTEDPFQTLDELTQALKEEGQLTSHDTNRQTVEMKRYPIKDTRWNFVSDAILYGHESWITNVHWCINPSGSLQLLSTSSDRSMIMWRPSEEFDNIWLNVERFGELGTSTNLGLFGAHYFIGPHDQAETVLASGWTRSWHRWGKEDKAVWEPQVAPTGHYSGVTGLDWEKEGEYLASCSDDQTTRLWGSWTSPQNNLEVLSNPSWHEICRPQAHGHNLFGVSFIGDRRSRFVSISEEKVIRVFDMTQDFLQVTQELGITQLPFDKVDARPQRAIVPPLGLSNRVEDTEKDQKEQQDPAGQQSCPPFEDQLLSHTLWPEIDKIYGHPSELSAITTSHCGRIIASACHATSAQTASIRLHSADDFSPIQPGVLEAHQLTVTRLVFNSDASKLLSVSRDRSWTIWNKSPSSDGFVIDQRMEKAHARVIWDACWATIPSINMFVTGSRDKSVKTWIQSGQDNQVSWDVAHAIKCDQPVKSCAISTQLTQQTKMLLAVGLEDGFISLYMSVNPSGWERIGGVELTSIHHAGPVNRLAFSPKVVEAGKFRLASGGEDEVVQIVDLNLNP
ncbi:hypothetical protein MJO28_014429 [Puccinia striiformis f. sp. tritici]|uniref:Uncharacterized protein n=1 Tax=Puccinia striiformis f. sp. tritici TaxID=168172 RepID=A0ACC0DVL0_9BASI|nr:hypothetical protein Pst134EB_027444 [Puccinia striiformis f. sp. tritici]KAI7938850.1 hypothetical protein MJO28_014429 [Puccinia striiformis f. sp. tritici]KAI7939559.1 hypothetical protein MJO29_014295 [Puccinia striiformis f. sp. tritici]